MARENKSRPEPEVSPSAHSAILLHAAEEAGTR